MTDSFFKDFHADEPVISQTSFEPDHTCGDIYDLANAFLSIESMTHKKLQKLCYYAKAWYLAIYDTNIVSEPFEAWVQGAVQPKLYQKYRSYGFQYIPMYAGSQTNLPEEFLEFAGEVFSSYGNLTGCDLEKLNHEELPWLNARRGLKPWQSCNVEISEDDMKAYYRELMNNEKNTKHTSC